MRSYCDTRSDQPMPTPRSSVCNGLNASDIGSAGPVSALAITFGSAMLNV